MIKKVIKVNSKDISTDNFRPIIKVGLPYYKIYQVLGKPITINRINSSVTTYWKVVLDDDSVFSIYDWDRDLDSDEGYEENLFWCIASETPSVAKDALRLFDIYNLVKVFDDRFLEE